MHCSVFAELLAAALLLRGSHGLRLEVNDAKEAPEAVNAVLMLKLADTGSSFFDSLFSAQPEVRLPELE